MQRTIVPQFIVVIFIASNTSCARATTDLKSPNGVTFKLCRIKRIGHVLDAPADYDPIAFDCALGPLAQSFSPAPK